MVLLGHSRWLPGHYCCYGILIVLMCCHVVACVFFVVARGLVLLWYFGVLMCCFVVYWAFKLVARELVFLWYFECFNVLLCCCLGVLGGCRWILVAMVF